MNASPALDANAPPPPGLGLMPLLSLQRHWRVSLVVFFLIVVVGLPVVWIKGQSIYSAEAVFHVAPRYMKNLESDAEVELQSNSQYREFVNQLQNTVTRYDVLERALATLKEKGIDPRPPALSPREYNERLQRMLVTRAIPDTYMVRVRLEGGIQEKPQLHALVNAVMASFLDTSRTEQIYGSAERLNVLRDSERALRAEIAGLDEERATLGARLGLTTFTDGVQNPYDRLLAELRSALATAEIERKRAEANHKAFTERGEIPADLGRSLQEMRLGDLGLIALRGDTAKRIAELGQKIDGLTAKHPAREPAEAEIRQLRDRLAAAEHDFTRNNVGNVDTRLAATLQQRRLVEDGIRQNVTNLEGQASAFALTFQRAMHLTREINDRSERIQTIQKRLNYLETESNALGFVRIVTPALPAEMPQGPGKTKLLLGLLIAAFGAALLLPTGIDLLDRRIRSVGEVERLMQIPAAGWQIRREDLPTGLYADEQSRRFAATLMRLRARQQRQVFAFTAVKAQGGTTHTVLDTASMLCRLGARVLVVEANTFSPFAGFADTDHARPGFRRLLQDGLDPHAVTQAYAHQDQAIDVIAIGDTNADGIGLQRLDRLPALLEQWRTAYEYILVDLPPLLLSADSEMLATQIGHVFLVVKAEAESKGEIGRAKRLLQKIDPDAVGVFVNAVPLFRGSGYMQENIVETVTRGRFADFMVGPAPRLHWDIARTAWAVKRPRALRWPWFGKRVRG